jgi:hypothetical protein
MHKILAAGAARAAAAAAGLASFLTFAGPAACSHLHQSPCDAINVVIHYSRPFRAISQVYVGCNATNRQLHGRATYFAPVMVQ